MKGLVSQASIHVCKVILSISIHCNTSEVARSYSSVSASQHPSYFCIYPPLEAFLHLASIKHGIMSASKRPRTDADEAEHKDVVEIDPRGDLVLQVGTESSLLLRMSSSVLMRVSNVFQAMLEGKFVEATIKHDANDPLMLPEDDPHAMELMCKLLMYQMSDPTELDPAQLPRLTVICDKYQCLTSLRVWFYMGINDFEFFIPDPAFKKGVKTSFIEHDGLKYIDALAIAYLIDDRLNFRSISHEVFMTYTRQNIEQEMHSGLAEIMPDDFRGKSNRLMMTTRLTMA